MIVVNVSPFTIPKQLIGNPSDGIYVTQLVDTAVAQGTQGIAPICLIPVATSTQ
jgi:hypothetical protein